MLCFSMDINALRAKKLEANKIQLALRASISIEEINTKKEIARRALILNQICLCPTDNQ